MSDALTSCFLGQGAHWKAVLVRSICFVTCLFLPRTGGRYPRRSQSRHWSQMPSMIPRVRSLLPDWKPSPPTTLSLVRSRGWGTSGSNSSPTSVLISSLSPLLGGRFIAILHLHLTTNGTDCILLRDAKSQRGTPSSILNATLCCDGLGLNSTGISTVVGNTLRHSIVTW